MTFGITQKQSLTSNYLNVVNLGQKRKLLLSHKRFRISLHTSEVDPYVGDVKFYSLTSLFDKSDPE